MSALDTQAASSRPDLDPVEPGGSIRAQGRRKLKATSARPDLASKQGNAVARGRRKAAPSRLDQASKPARAAAAGRAIAKHRSPTRTKPTSPVPFHLPRPEVLAGARPLAIVPRSMGEALDLAKAVVAARLAPRGLETAEACMIAILHGLEVGLMPMAALQRIAVIDGRPTMWGDGALALVRASGCLASISETVDGKAETEWVATCHVLRRGDPHPIARSFGVADARRAGLWGRPGPWQEHPRRMLQMRARAFALRDAFPDVLGGLYLREEFEEPMRSIAPPPPPLAQSPAVEVPASFAAPQPAAKPSNDAVSAGTSAAVSSTMLGRPVSPGVEGRHDGARKKSARPVRTGQARRAMRATSPARRSRIWRPLGEAAAAVTQNLATAALAERHRDLLSKYDDALCCAFDSATLDEIEEEFALVLERLPDGLLREAATIKERHVARVAAAEAEGKP